MARRGATAPIGYSLQFKNNQAAAGTSPADSTTYYYPLGGAVGAFTTAGNMRFGVPQAGRITAITVAELHTTTDGTGESVAYKIYVNGSLASTLVTNVTWNQGLSTWRGPTVYTTDSSAVPLNVALAAGDYVDFAFLSPTWATNPAGVFIMGSAFVTTA